MADLEDRRARELFVALEEAFRAGEPAFDSLCARVEDPALRQTLIARVASGEFDVNQERVVTESVKRIKHRSLSRKREELDAEMRRLEHGTPDPARMRELLAEKMHLDSELVKLDPWGDTRLPTGART
jgi:DNA primase